MERSPPFLRCNKLGPLSCVLPLPLSSPPSPLCPLNISGEEKKAKKKRKKGPPPSFPSPPLHPLLHLCVQTPFCSLPPPCPSYSVVCTLVATLTGASAARACRNGKMLGGMGKKYGRQKQISSSSHPASFRHCPNSKGGGKEKSFCAPFFCLHLYKSPPGPPSPPKKRRLCIASGYFGSLFFARRGGAGADGEAWLCSVL